MSGGAALGPPLPLGHGQRALWFLHRAAPASAAYIIAGAGRILSPVDGDLLRRSFLAIVERHAALRTVFRIEDGAPVQRVGPPHPGLYEEADASGWSAAELPERLAERLFRPVDLEGGPAFRVLVAADAPGGAVLAVSLHHAVGDLWSLAVVLREVGEVYGELAAGRDGLAGLPELPLSYAEWAAREAGALAEEEGTRLRRFWHERLAGGVPVLELPTDRPRPPLPSYQGTVVSRPLGGGEAGAGAGRDLRGALKAVARYRATTLLSALLAGFQALLGRYAGQDRFAVGTPTSGRVHSPGASTAEISGLVGYFVNPVPVRADLSGDPTFVELLDRVREEAAGALAHQGYPFPLLAEELAPGGDRSRAPLFQTMLVLQKSPIPGMRRLPAFALGREGAPLRLGPLAIESVGVPQRGAQFDLTLFVTEEDGELVASLEYDTALFEAATAERMLGHLETLLGAASEDPGRRVTELPMLGGAELRQLLGGWAAEADLPDDGRLLHELVAEQADRTPGACALVTGETRLTYRELVDLGGTLGRGLRARLRARRAPAEAPVGVFLPRGAELVAALLGVLEAGAAYVPLDPAYPGERLATVIADSAMPLIVTEESLRSRLDELPLGGAEVVTVAEALETGRHAPSPEAPAPAAPDRLAYVIYTSGSTGRPKGVAISHRNAVAMVRWAGGAFLPEELARVLASTSVCFDLSVFELFAPLAHGGRAVLVDDALGLPELAAEDGVTLINTVPSAMTRLLEARALPPSVRTVSLAGEPLRRSLVEAAYAAGAERVVNLYGPSEDTTYSTIAECPRDEDREPTIGRPVAGGRAYVVDRGLRPVPRGVPGELLLGGAGVARGYLGRPALTAQRFVPDAYGPTAEGGRGGGRLYRTGDRVRLLPDRRLEFLGRIDHQVKVRGFRIEPGEVEVALRAHPSLADAVVVARGEGADRMLVGYLVPRSGTGSGVVTRAEVRDFLGARLPAYMVPSAFVLLDALPLTPSGKVDRGALPEPGSGRPDLRAGYVAPETEVEELLAALWSEVLGVERIGIHDSFFELGGHSLKATEVLLRVRELFGVEVPVHDLFERPTIAGLERAIADALLAATDGAAEVLAGLDG